MADLFVHQPLNVLFVAHNPADALALQTALNQDGLNAFLVTWTDRAAAGFPQSLNRLAPSNFQVIVVDIDHEAPRFVMLEQICRQWPAMPVLAYSANADEEEILQALRAGAQDYLLKTPEGCAAAPRLIRRVLERQRFARSRQPEDGCLIPFIEQSYDGIAMVDEQGIIVRWNPAQESITGLSKESALGAQYWEMQIQILTPEVRAHYGVERMKRVLQRAFKIARCRKLKEPLEIEIQTSSGERKFIQILYFPIHTTGAAYIGALTRDITQQRQALLTLRESEARLKGFLDSAPDAMVIANIEGQIILANVQTEKMFGYTHDELLRLTAEDLACEAVRERHIQGRAQFFTQPQYVTEGVEREIYGRRKGGEEFPIEVSLSHHTLADGRVVVLAAIREVSARKQIEARLREARQRLLEAQQLAHIGHWTWDLQTETLTWSDEVYRIFGVEPDAFTPSVAAFENAIHPDDKEDFVRQRAQMLSEKQIACIDHRIFLPDGQVRYVQERTQLGLAENGEVGRVLGTVQDITERKQAEEALRRSTQLLYEAQTLANLGSWTADVQRATFDAAPESARLIGWTPGVHTMQELLDVFHPDDREAMRLQWEAAQHGSSFDLEHRVVVNGEVRWMHVSAKMAFDKDGRAISALGISQDITERKREEERRREADERYRLLFETMAQGVVFQAADGHIIHANSSAEKILGLTLDQMQGRTSIDPRWRAIHEDGSAFPGEAHPAMLALQSGRPVQNVVMGVYNPACSATRWINISAMPRFKEGEAQPYQVYTTFEDITERKQENRYLQARLRLANLSHQALEMEELMRAMLDEAEALTESTIGFFHFVDDDQQTIYLQTWSTHTLAKMCTAEGKGQHYPVTEAGVWANGIRHARAYIYNDYPALPDRRGLPPGHATITRLISLPIVRNNRVAAAFGVGNKPYDYDQNDLDVLGRLAEEAFGIILRKRVEQALRESEEKYRGLMESLDNQVAVIDGEGRFIYLNDRAAEPLGRAAQEIVGKTIFEVFPAELHSQQMQDIRWVMQENKSKVIERVEVNPGPRWYRTTIQPLRDENGRVSRVLINSMDIHELKTTQQELQELNRTLEERVQQRTTEARSLYESLRRANLELERALRLKDEFLAYMSHELRTPLNAILGISEILLAGYRGPLNERQHNFVSAIDTSGRHLLSLINDLLDVSKIEAGKVDIHLETVIISDVCQASLSFVKEQASKKGVALGFKYEKTALKVMADQRRLKQILVNLLSNAVKFTPSGGEVKLSVRADLQKARVEFSVSDTGIGIAPADLERLFTPFTQVDSSLSRQHEGTGLGLVLVKRLAELHNGEVSVVSEVGKGSCFTVSLPWDASLDEQQAPAAPRRSDLSRSAPAGGAETTAASPGLILLAEDNEVNAMSLRDYLDGLGYNVIVAVNGVEALGKARAIQPDLILMDVQMPEMDGLEVIRRLRTEARFKDTPIIALTALAMPGDSERCLAAGANAYLSKPVSLKQLAALMSDLLRKG